jgi:hypothetical protein
MAYVTWAEPPGLVESADGAYEAKKVLDSEYRGKMRMNGTQKVWYCVNWLGYNGEADETTWEPEEAVASAEIATQFIKLR